MSSKDDDQPAGPKAVVWVGSSRKAVRQVFGQALYDTQMGDKHPAVKPLKGFGGAGVLEVVEDDNGSTYRAVSAVKFARVVYILHAFQMKSKSGVKTPAGDIEKGRAR
jgi:phage-related protein